MYEGLKHGRDGKTKFTMGHNFAFKFHVRKRLQSA